MPITLQVTLDEISNEYWYGNKVLRLSSTDLDDRRIPSPAEIIRLDRKMGISTK